MNGITPEGIALRARLTVDYIDQSFRLYRRVRNRVKDLLYEVQQAGFQQVKIIGDGDIADICRLSCLEHSIQIEDWPDFPQLKVQGMKVTLHFDGKEQ